MTEPLQGSPSSEPHRRIRSFVLRTGRTTVGQAKAFDTAGPKHLLPFSENAIDFAANFARGCWTNGQIEPQNAHLSALEASANAGGLQGAERPAPHVVLEIGFGMGEATAHIAQALPELGFLCCEVHTPGVGALLKRVEEMGLRNIKIIQHDAVEVLKHMIPLASLAGVHVFFPDPWHKKRHNKRRLIQSGFVADLVQHIRPGGYLHCATDWQPYAEHMLDVLNAEPQLRNTSAHESGYADKPAYRPLTKFENRGIRLGHGVWDLVFERRTHPIDLAK